MLCAISLRAVESHDERLTSLRHAGRENGWQRLNIFPGRLHHEPSLLGSLVAGGLQVPYYHSGDSTVEEVASLCRSRLQRAETLKQRS